MLDLSEHIPVEKSPECDREVKEMPFKTRMRPVLPPPSTARPALNLSYQRTRHCPASASVLQDVTLRSPKTVVPWQVLLRRCSLTLAGAASGSEMTAEVIARRALPQDYSTCRG